MLKGAAVKASEKVLGIMSLWKDAGETIREMQVVQLGSSEAWD